VSFDEFMQWVEEMAQQVFERHGEHNPIAFVQQSGGRMTIAVMALDTPSGRRAVFEYFCQRGAEAIVFVSEGWQARASSPLDVEAIELWKAEGRSLEDLPGREEVLMIWGAHPGGGRLVQWRIDRSERQPKLVDRHATDGASGILSDLPWQAVA
jgi:hypothetical protein